MLEVLVTVFNYARQAMGLATIARVAFKVYHWLKDLWGAIRKPPETLVSAPMTERDQEMADRTKQIVTEIFGQNAAATVEEADYNGRVALASNLIERLAEAYGVQLDGCELYIDSNINNCGGYSIKENQIKLNGAYLFSEDPDLIYEFIDTVIHELRHAVQFQSILNPEIAEAWQVSEETKENWKQNFLNYTPSTANLRAYMSQPVENDARTFAALSLRGWRPEE